MFSSQLNQVFFQVSGTILIAPERVASSTGGGELGRIDIPLVGQPRLDHHARAVAERGGDDAVLDRSSAPSASSSSTTRSRASKRSRPSKASGISPSAVCTSRASPSSMLSMSAGLEAGALADLEIVEVVARRDLDRAAAELRVGMLVGDDRDQPPGDRQLDLLADQRGVALVVGMDRDRHVGEHRLGPRGGDADIAPLPSASG